MKVPAQRPGGVEDRWSVSRVNYLTSTAFTLPGYRIAENLGVVRGVIVRSRSIVGTGLAALHTIIGGNIALFTQLCEKTRGDAFDLMVQHAADIGANAVIGVRYDATDIMRGVTEVLCYGTAVIVEEEASGKRP
ncbi:MAG: YbjQ family protein [Gemmatimonadota bacterium]|nr:YbjQ family protein [Gemmatimonadota bacterium]